MAAESYVKRFANAGTSENALDDELVQIFTDLEGQSKLPSFYDPQNPACLMPSILSSLPRFSLPRIPTQFATVSKAKTCLNLIQALINRLYSQGPHINRKESATLDDCNRLLNEWEVAFSTLLQNAQRIASTTQGSKFQKSYIPHFILASNHAMIKIINASNTGRCSEMFYDTMIPYFQKIIDYSKVIINTINSHVLPSFVFEVGVLPPLHVTGTKCRDPKLRREAIALLRKYPAQEGVWEGYGCAKACEWIMTIEEAGGADGLSSVKSSRSQESAGSIPEWDRVKLSSMVCWLHERRIWAQCTSVVPVLKGKNRVWEKTFTW